MLFRPVLLTGVVLATEQNQNYPKRLVFSVEEFGKIGPQPEQIGDDG